MWRVSREVAAHSLAAVRFAVAHIRAAVAIVLQLLVERLALVCEKEMAGTHAMSLVMLTTNAPGMLCSTSPRVRCAGSACVRKVRTSSARHARPHCPAACLADSGRAASLKALGGLHLFGSIGSFPFPSPGGFPIVQ